MGERAERPTDPPDESFRASWKRWRAYALQLERDLAESTERLERSKAAIQYLEEWGGNSVKRNNAALTAEVERLRKGLVGLKVMAEVHEDARLLRSCNDILALTPPAPKDKKPCTFPRCDCTSAVCPKEDNNNA